MKDNGRIKEIARLCLDDDGMRTRPSREIAQLKAGELRAFLALIAVGYVEKIPSDAPGRDARVRDAYDAAADKGAKLARIPFHAARTIIAGQCRLALEQKLRHSGCLAEAQIAVEAEAIVRQVHRHGSRSIQN